MKPTDSIQITSTPTLAPIPAPSDGAQTPQRGRPSARERIGSGGSREGAVQNSGVRHPSELRAPARQGHANCPAASAAGMAPVGSERLHPGMPPRNRIASNDKAITNELVRHSRAPFLLYPPEDSLGGENSLAKLSSAQDLRWPFIPRALALQAGNDTRAVGSRAAATPGSLSSQAIPEPQRSNLRRTQSCLEGLSALRHYSRNPLSRVTSISETDSPSEDLDSTPNRTTRQAVVDFIQELKEKLNDNQQPDLEGKTRFLELLVQSEKVNHPEFNIRLVDNSNPIDAILQEFVNGQPSCELRWHAVVNIREPDSTGGHRIAASISHGDGDDKHVSVIFVESMRGSLDSWGLDTYRHQLREQGYRFVFTYLETETQNAQGCTFFALKNIKYMAASKAIEAQHARNHNNFSDFTNAQFHYVSKMSPMDLEPTFFKHCSSLRVLDAYLLRARNDDATSPVNKKGVSLRDRVTSNLVTRPKLGSSETMTHSNSIEKVRIKKYEQILLTLDGSLQCEELRDRDGA